MNDAAVLILSYHENGDEYLVFTRRTEEVLHHKGQICFPGGARDPGDASLWETALRETEEEIGLDPKQVKFIRELSAHPTPSGFRVAPFLASIAGPMIWKPNPHEIAEIFSAPLSHLRNPAHLRLEEQEWNGTKFINPVFSYKDHRIWGVTGRILCDVLEIPLRRPE